MFKKRLKKTWKEVRFVLYMTLFVVGVMGFAGGSAYLIEKLGMEDIFSIAVLSVFGLILAIFLLIALFAALKKVKEYIVWQFVEPYRDWKANKKEAN